MNQLEFSMLWAIMQELFGAFFYPVLLLLALLAVTFSTLIAKERQLMIKRYTWAKRAGIVGGILSLIMLFLGSQSDINDLSSPIDLFILMFSYFAGFIASTLLVYTLLGWSSSCKSCQK
ncbi:DUF5368 domain-containing protein [Bibersteinia trehalosi]|uniref:DUF5368 domain-containing protein n=1 Tax=Bibersteinia trehalosi TaxID=47735 RepID=UPI002D76FFF7|nr:DUF5368 domain-containing protein [Bibersteinia trehalosi]